MHKGDNKDDDNNITRRNPESLSPGRQKSVWCFLIFAIPEVWNLLRANLSRPRILTWLLDCCKVCALLIVAMNRVTSCWSLCHVKKFLCPHSGQGARTPPPAHRYIHPVKWRNGLVGSNSDKGNVLLPHYCAMTAHKDCKGGKTTGSIIDRNEW